MEQLLDTAAKKNLLRIAREAIRNYLKIGKVQDGAGRSGIEIKAGAFVTLHKRGELRGCIGTFYSTRVLPELVQQMAIAAAFEDPRFIPVRENELDDIDIEISVLSPLREIKDTNEIEVGRHGIYITQGYRSGVLLPQVATEQGWDRDTFLAHTCLKAGLRPDAWKDPKTKIEIFTAEVFGEKELGLRHIT